jgi:hypothetical protein
MQVPSTVLDSTASAAPDVPVPSTPPPSQAPPGKRPQSSTPRRAKSAEKAQQSQSQSTPHKPNRSASKESIPVPPPPSPLGEAMAEEWRALDDDNGGPFGSDGAVAMEVVPPAAAAAPPEAVAPAATAPGVVSLHRLPVTHQRVRDDMAAWYREKGVGRDQEARRWVALVDRAVRKVCADEGHMVPELKALPDFIERCGALCGRVDKNQNFVQITVRAGVSSLIGLLLHCSLKSLLDPDVSGRPGRCARSWMGGARTSGSSACWCDTPIGGA